MNRRDKVIVTTVVGVLLLGFGAVALAGDKKKDGACPPGMKPNLKRIAALAAARTPAARAAAAAMPVCVPIECPAGFERDAFDNCISTDDPEVHFCPVGQHWDAERGECVADDDPTDCPPDQVFDVSTELCRPRCPDGSRWSPAEGACMPIDPVSPTEETCPEGMHWVPPRLGMPDSGRCVADAPTDDIDDYIKDYPTDGAFYKVKAGDFPGWAIAGKKTKAVVQNQFGSALLAAAREYGGLDGPAALAWANARRVNQSITNALYNALMCCAWDDMTVGTWGYCGQKAVTAGRCDSTAKQHPGEHGRAIRFLKQHADNILRMRQGLAPARTVSIGSPQNAGDGLSAAVGSATPGGNTSYPTLWLPGINRQVLWESDGKTLEFDSDRALPPDFIWDRGFENLSGASANLPAYGCNSGGYTGQASV